MRLSLSASSFNEAPALHGGKPEEDEACKGKQEASMRPPHYTGENRAASIGNTLLRCFNEAPALHGGKRPPADRNRRQRPASMRPPHYTGENDGMAQVVQVGSQASMRPPHYTGENAAPKLA